MIGYYNNTTVNSSSDILARNLVNMPDDVEKEYIQLKDEILTSLENKKKEIELLKEIKVGYVLYPIF